MQTYLAVGKFRDDRSTGEIEKDDESRGGNQAAQTAKMAFGIGLAAESSDDRILQIRKLTGDRPGIQNLAVFWAV